MKFGKVTDINGIDFSLPKEDERNAEFMSGYTEYEGSELLLGCTGWSQKEWKGLVFPPKTPQNRFLAEYSKQFQTVELNSTHYAIPRHEIILKWKESSTADFVFCPKVLQYISHSRNLGIGTGRIERFCEAMSLFEEKLGPCFIQLPPHFGIERLSQLAAFMEVFPSDMKLAVEVRHPSFFDTIAHIDQFCALMEKHRAIAVITDVAGRRDVAHMRLTTDEVFVRFVGNELSHSDHPRIDEWKERISLWRGFGVKRFYFFLHQPDNIKAPQLARYMYDKTMNMDQLNVKRPKFHNETGQLDLFS